MFQDRGDVGHQLVPGHVRNAGHLEDEAAKRHSEQPAGDQSRPFLGRAIAHVVWAATRGGRFPGLYTAVVYRIIGPILPAKLTGSARTAGIVVVFAIIPIPALLTTTA